MRRVVRPVSPSHVGPGVVRDRLRRHVSVRLQASAGAAFDGRQVRRVCDLVEVAAPKQRADRVGLVEPMFQQQPAAGDVRRRARDDGRRRPVHPRRASTPDGLGRQRRQVRDRRGDVGRVGQAPGRSGRPRPATRARRKRDGHIQAARRCFARRAVPAAAGVHGRDARRPRAACLTASAIAPLPVPRSSTAGCRRQFAAQQFQRPVDQGFGVGRGTSTRGRPAAPSGRGTPSRPAGRPQRFAGARRAGSVSSRAGCWPLRQRASSSCASQARSRPSTWPSSRLRVEPVEAARLPRAELGARSMSSLQWPPFQRPVAQRRALKRSAATPRRGRRPRPAACRASG